MVREVFSLCLSQSLNIGIRPLKLAEELRLKIHPITSKDRLTTVCEVDSDLVEPEA